MVKGGFKIIHYMGYGYQMNGVAELYNIASDPEEMVDLAAKRPPFTQELLDDLLSKLAEADHPSMGNRSAIY